MCKKRQNKTSEVFTARFRNRDERQSLPCFGRFHIGLISEDGRDTSSPRHIFGRQHVAAAVRRGFERAEQAERLLRQRPEWRVVTPAQMGIVTFRCVPEGASKAEIDALNRRLAPAVSKEGEMFLTQTALDDRPVLRLCPINPRTTAEDIETTINRLDQVR